MPPPSLLYIQLTHLIKVSNKMGSEKAGISTTNVIKATMKELTEDERRAYLVAEEHLKKQFLQGFKKESGGLFKRVGEFLMPSSS